MLSKFDCAKAFVSDVARTLVSSECDGFSFSDDLLDVVSKLVERMLVSSGEDPARIHASKKEFFASCKEKKDDKEWKGIPRSLATLLEYFLVELLMGGGREMFLLGLFFCLLLVSCHRIKSAHVFVTQNRLPESFATISLLQRGSVRDR